MASETLSGKSNALGVAWGLFSAIAFAVLVPGSKMVLQSLTPLQVAALLLLGGGIGAGCFALIRIALGRGKSSSAKKILRSDAPKLALMIALNATAVGLLIVGVHHVLATNASLLMGFEIAAATVFGWVLFRRHLCYKAGAAVALICVATALLCWNVIAPASFVPESLFIVAACVLRGLEGGFKKTLADKDPLQVACVRSLVAGIILAIVAIAVDGLPTAGFSTIASTVLLGFVTFGIGASLHLLSQRTLGSARSEAYFALAPFIAMIVSWAMFGFALEPLFFGALSLMALGVWLAMDDSVFHEDAFAALDRERMALYTGEAHSFGFDRMHRPL